MARILILFVLLALLVETKFTLAKTVPELIKSEKYPVEEHFVTTKTGFILAVHRIPSGKKKTSPTQNATKPVVLLQHGFATSSDSWVLSGPKQALGYLLADKGYDVWLANSRGTKYSFNHTKLDLENKKDLKKFNRYSFYEKGMEDLPETIDYVLAQTKQKKLTLYAHSEGASMFYAMGARKPKYLNKINAFFGFAPLVFIGNTTSPIVKILALFNRFYLTGVTYQFGTPFVQFATNILSFLAGNILMRASATIPFTFISGSAHFSGTTVSRLYDHFPSYVSSRQLDHLMQLINSKGFKEYDYPIFDLWHILQFHPKKFDLKKINIPHYLYFSDGDLFVNPDNIGLFNESFKIKPKVFYVHNEFGHYDFVYGSNAHKVYQLTYDKLEEHSKQGK